MFEYGSLRGPQVMKIQVCEWIQKSEKRRIAILTRIDFAAADSPAGGARATSLWTFDCESEAPPSGHLINICHNYLQEPQGNGSVTSSRGRERRTEGGWGGQDGGRERRTDGASGGGAQAHTGSIKVQQEAEEEDEERKKRR